MRRRMCKKRESFLHRFSITAKEIFHRNPNKGSYKTPLSQKLIELARREFGYGEDVYPFDIYRELSYVWNNIYRRSKRWHRGIDLVPMDLEK